MTFSDKIKRAREVAKMTQHELAQEYPQPKDDDDGF